MAERLGLGQVANTLELPQGQSSMVFVKRLRRSLSRRRRHTGETLDPTVGAATDLAETLAVIEYRIAEVFAQLTGDAPLSSLLSRGVRSSPSQ